MIILKTRIFFLTVFLAVCFHSQAQIDDFQKEIVDYLNINGTRDQYRDAYDSVYTTLSKNFGKHNIPDKIWNEMKKDKEEEVDEVLNDLSFAYRNNFTREQIQQMNEFHNSEAAQKMKKGEELTDTERQAINDFYEGPLGELIATKQTKLDSEMEVIERNWKRDIFKEKMQWLIKNGHVQ